VVLLLLFVQVLAHRLWYSTMQAMQDTWNHTQHPNVIPAAMLPALGHLQAGTTQQQYTHAAQQHHMNANHKRFHVQLSDLLRQQKQ
jgi:hypothetical protein